MRKGVPAAVDPVQRLLQGFALEERGHRGPGGGYRLGMPATDISVAAIMIAAEDSPTAQRSKQNITKVEGENCPTDPMWRSLNGLIYNLLDHVSLDDVVAERVEVYEKLFRTEEKQ